MNYKTGVRAVRFTLHVGSDRAVIAIVVDAAYEHPFLGLRKAFAARVGDDWVWQPGNISVSLPDVDIRRRDDWPALISFFKTRLVALDAFWQEVKPIVLRSLPQPPGWHRKINSTIRIPIGIFAS